MPCNITQSKSPNVNGTQTVTGRHRRNNHSCCVQSSSKCAPMLLVRIRCTCAQRVRPFTFSSPHFIHASRQWQHPPCRWWPALSDDVAFVTGNVYRRPSTAYLSRRHSAEQRAALRRSRILRSWIQLQLGQPDLKSSMYDSNAEQVARYIK